MLEVQDWSFTDSVLSLLHELVSCSHFHSLLFQLFVLFDVQPDKLAESFQYFLQGLGLGKSAFILKKSPFLQL